MFGKAWSWIRGLSDLVTLVQFAGSVGLAGLLAIIGQEAIGTALQLSPVLRLLLSVCIFLIVFAAALAALKAVLERWSASKAATQGSGAEQGLTPQSSEYSLWQELKRVETENQQLRDTLQQYEQENKQLRDWIGLSCGLGAVGDV